MSSLIPHPSSLALLIVLTGAISNAWAQAISDPTRPPGGVSIEVDPAADAGGMMLQSVLISPTHRAAIISGVMVKLGERYGDAVLVKVAENEVVLKSAGASQVLKLYPGVEKREVMSAAEKESRRGKAGTTSPR